jgi:hypothetical protein
LEKYSIKNQIVPFDEKIRDKIKKAKKWLGEVRHL